MVLYLGHIITREGVFQNGCCTQLAASTIFVITTIDLFKKSNIATPLNQLLQKDAPFHCDGKCETVFCNLKHASNA